MVMQMSKKKDILKKYIVKKYGLQFMDKIIRQNYLHLLYDENPHSIDFLRNKAYVILAQNELLKVNRLFCSFDIKYISFKGVVLANALYDNIYSRFFTDIDLYVSPNDFEKALKILLDNDYQPRYPDTFLNPHHIVLSNGQISLELHKHILSPHMKIDEKYLLSHTEIVIISEQSIQTFDATATLLHLLYHLYMDTNSVVRNLYYTFVNKEIPKAGRFLYRAFEIALFAEKYYKKINWDDIQNDIKHQQLCIIFKEMIFDILEIFPNAFPQKFLNTILEFDYVDDERNPIYSYLLRFRAIGEACDIESALCDYIDNNWNVRRKRNIHRTIGERIHLSKISTTQDSQSKLSCSIGTKKLSDGIELSFNVSDEEFYYSEIENYDTYASDGVHLFLCSTEEYSYNSIFLFPKYINGKIEVVVCNVVNYINLVLENKLMNATFTKIEEGYIITVFISNEFITNHYMNNYFYMGLIVSDCDRKTGHRTNELILSESDSEWHNPAYYAKIEMY